MTSSPDRLRGEVEATRAAGSTANVPRRRKIVRDLCEELSHQAQVDAKADTWEPLRAAIDPTAAINGFLRRIEQCGDRDEESYGPNATFGDAVSTAVELTSLLSSWPSGLEALAEHQLVDMSKLATGDEGLDKEPGVLRPQSGPTLGLDEVRGLCALLYLRPTLTCVSLERVKLTPIGLVTLAGVLPDSITSLSLKGADCAAKGTDLRGVRAVCERISSGGGSPLTTLNLSRNVLPDAAAAVLVKAMQTEALTSLDLSGNKFGPAAIEQLSAAALSSSLLADFGGVPLAQLRVDGQGAELDLRQHELGLLEAHCLSQLLSTATSLASLQLEGQTKALPLGLLCGRGRAPPDEAVAAAEEAAGEAATSLVPRAGRTDAEEELKTVELAHCKLGDPAAVLIGFAIGSASSSSLVELDLGYNSIKPEAIGWLARGIGQSPSLASLSLAWNRLGPEGLASLAPAVATSTSLATLVLDNNTLCGVNDFGQGTYNDDGLSALAEALVASPHLTALDLSNNNLCGCNQRGVGPRTTRGLDLLRTALPRSGVTELTLDGNYFGVESACHLLDCLKTRPTLTSLRMADCTITDGIGRLDAVDILSAMLKGNRFRVLGLDGNKLGLGGVNVLAAGLKGAGAQCELSDLHLDREGNDLDEDAEAVISKAVSKHPDAALHLARSAPAHEKQQEKADLKVRDYLMRNAIDPGVSPTTNAALSISIPEGGGDGLMRQPATGPAKLGARSAAPTPRKPGLDVKKPLTSSPRTAR